jgi:hypothetical protein
LKNKTESRNKQRVQGRDIKRTEVKRRQIGKQKMEQGEINKRWRHKDKSEERNES